MLDKMRENSRSFVIYFFFTILILVFVFEFGPQSGGWVPQEKQDVAFVDGDKIDQAEVDMEYIRNYGWGTARNSELKDVLQQKRELVDHLVNMRLLAEEARKAGLVATKEETAAYIQDPDRNFDYRNFTDDDGFSADQYQRIVQNAYGTSLHRYESGRRRDLLARRLVGFLAGQVRVPEAQIKDEWLTRNTKVNVEFVAFRADAEDEPAPPTDAQVATYAKSEAEAVKAWYDGHKEDFVRPKEVKIRQVFVRGPKADEAARTKAKDKALGLRSRIAEGDDMAEMARSESDHVSYKDKGGDMGWQRAGNNDPDFDKAAFALGKGELSEVVETEIGFFVLRAEDVREATDTTLEAATSEIARKLLAERGRSDAAKRRAVALLAAIKGGASLADATAGLNGSAPAEADGDDNDDDDNDGDDNAADAKWSVEETGEFTQEGGTGAPDPTNPFRFRRAWDSVPKIGKSAAASKAAFALTKDAPLAADPVEVEGVWYALSLKARIDPDEAKYADERDALAEELRVDRTAAVLGPWERALFTPKSSLRFFGGAPKLGPWLASVLDKARGGASIQVDDAVFKVQDAAAGAAGAGPTSAPTAVN